MVLNRMTRTQAIAALAEKLSALDDEELMSVAEHVDDLAGRDGLRALTQRELALIEQSKADFAAGRTYSLDEARAVSDAVIKEWRKKYPDAP